MSNALAEAAKASGLTLNNPGGVLGIENMDDKDLQIGSIILVQDGLKVFTKKGIKPGSYVNTATEKALEDLTFIPAYMTKRYFLYDNSGPIPKCIGSSENENDPMFTGKLRNADKKNNLKAEVFPGIVVVAVMSGSPVKIIFRKAASYNAGKKLYTYAREAARNSGLPLFGQKYVLKSYEEPAKNGNPEYWATTVEVVGPTTEEERAFAQSVYNGFKAKVADLAGAEEVPF